MQKKCFGRFFCTAALCLSAGLLLNGCNSGNAGNQNVAENDTENTEQTKEKQKVTYLENQSPKAGDTLEIKLLDYKEEDVVSTEWKCVDEVYEEEGLVPYTVKESDKEKVICYTVKFKDDSSETGYAYYSDLPVLYMDCDVSYNFFVGKPLEYIEVEMKLASGEYGTEQLYDGEAGLRLRGNSTANLVKKPFKLKLDKKTDLLGMGENKHWVLLANAIDSTNLRNKLLYDFAGEIGAKVFMESELVSMVFNGEYMGVYQLCEQPRIDENRVEIYNWEDTAEAVADALLRELQEQKYLTKEQRKEVKDAVEDELKADYSWLSNGYEFESRVLTGLGTGIPKTILLEKYVNLKELDIPEVTGGALLEMDFYEGANAELLTAYKQPIYFHTPENRGSFPALTEYMKTYIQSLEYALHDTDFIYQNSDAHYFNINEGRYSRSSNRRKDVKYQKSQSFESSYDGYHYSDLMDMDSAVVNFLVCEFSRNWDCMKNSVFMYKDIDDKLFLAPSWDFDWAWGNSMYNIYTDIPDGWQTTDEYFASEQYYQSVQWNRYLVRDPYFLQRVYEKYQEIRPTVIEDMIKEGGLFDTYYQKYADASHANDARWGGSEGTYRGACYDEEFERMKEFVQKRVEWLDEQFESLETFRKSVGYYVTSDKISVESVDTTTKSGYAVITATTSEEKAQYISFQVNGTFIEQAKVTDGKAVVEIPESAWTKTEGQKNVVQVRAMVTDKVYIANDDGSTYGDYSNAVSNYAVF